MTKKLSELTEKYPEVFGTPIEGNYSFSFFGFECGDGWYDLLDKLCADLTPLIEAAKKENPDYKFHILQIKEKFGGLRFYPDTATQEMWELIEKAEEDSEEICEVCGKPGEVRGGPWLLCRCDECSGDKSDE